MGDGEELQDVAGGATVEDVVDLGTEDAILVEEKEGEMLDSIPWHVTVVGCVAIWAVTVPLQVARQ